MLTSIKKLKFSLDIGIESQQTYLNHAQIDGILIGQNCWFFLLYE